MLASLRVAAIATLVVSTALASSCSRTSGAEKIPAACTGGDSAARIATLRAALAHAPGRVAFPDGTRISDCLAHDAASGDVQDVGSMLLTLTQQVMGATAPRENSRTLLELGYLAGAVHRGAARAQGVDGEIERRIDQELGTVNTAAAPFQRGERAGRTTG